MFILVVTINTTGYDFNFNGSDHASRTISGSLGIVLPETVAFQIVDDLVPGEVEKFVVDLSNAQLIDLETGTTLEVLVANSLTVKILDDDGQ